MKLIDADALERSRARRTCEVCGEPMPADTIPDVHHVMQRGLADGARLDHDWNLLACHRWCHSAIHAGKVSRRQLLETIARREGVTPEDIEEAMWLLLRTPK